MTDATDATAGVIETRVLVSGMTCRHCVSSVTEEVSALAGVQSVSVDLEPAGASTVTITSNTALAANALRDAISEAGYELANS